MKYVLILWFYSLDVWLVFCAYLGPVVDDEHHEEHAFVLPLYAFVLLQYAFEQLMIPVRQAWHHVVPVVALNIEMSAIDGRYQELDVVHLSQNAYRMLYQTET